MSSQNTIRILSIDNSNESRQALQQFLNRSPDLLLAAEATDAEQAENELQKNAVDVALIDLSASDINPIGLTKKIHQAHPNVRVLIVASSDHPEDIFDAMDSGADGYLLKENIASGLDIAIRSVKLGAVWLDPGIARQVLRAIESPPKENTRVLPTGIMPIPLLPDEKSLLNEVAASSCADGVCMVDPSFVRKLRRYHPTSLE